ncbi:MAG TPA: YaeQ family protein [Burkholderiales bacterium]|nr:YaeQ family protein [Burkholderiales bacterium]
MALKATIFKAVLQIADMDRSYYHDHALTIARHPSETDERMMVRVLAFALRASESLTFGKGLSTEDEPDLWQKDLTGAIQSWIDVGQPDEKRVRRACGRADQVFVYSFGSNAASAWWDQASGTLARMQNLTVTKLASASTRELALLANRNMHLTCTIQEGQVWMSDEKQAVTLLPECVQAPAPVTR